MVVNRQVQLTAYPRGQPRPGDFRIVETPVPRPRAGQFLVRGIYLSLDPWQRLRMRDPAEFQGQYGQVVALDTVLPGAVVGEIVESRHADFRVGEFIEAKLGWQLYGVSDGAGDRSDDAAGVVKVDPARGPLSTALSVLGRTGMTAYFALLDLGRPKSGETVLVSTAAGATGSIAGQIAKIQGCRAVGLAGSDEKVAFLTDVLGFDAAINYRASDDLGQAMAEACPNGVDVYLDHVGGEVGDLVWRHMNDWGRWVVIGHIADYDKPIHDHRGLRPQGYVLAKRLRMEGFIVHDYAPRFPEAIEAMAAWLAAGRLRYREHVAEGLERAPDAFIEMLRGGNIGKTLVRIGAEPAG
jgi:hypothetical protein